MFTDSTSNEIDKVMTEAWEAFHVYRKLSLQRRADFMKSIAFEIEACGDLLIQTAMAETNLPEVRLKMNVPEQCFNLINMLLFVKKVVG